MRQISAKADQKQKPMARIFKFNLGDVVRLKEGAGQLMVLIENGTKEYREHLTVVYCFWDGGYNSYVLNTGDNGICLVCEELALELEEGAPMPEEELVEDVRPECAKENHFLGHVYLINNRLVAAEGLEKSIEIFRSHPSHQYETIRSITLENTDLALIQNGREE